MSQFLLRAAARLGAWAIGLLLAAKVIPYVSMSASGFIVAVVLFSVTQTALSWFILKLPHGYAAMLLGSTALALTFAAMGLSSALTHGLRICGTASWVATALVVWLTTTICAILLPDVYTRRAARST